MALGTFALKAKGKASSFDPRVNHDKPLIVVPREFRPNFTTQRFPNPKDVVIVDVVELLADTVHVSVIWGGSAMVDAIKDHVPAEGQEPTKLPVMIKRVDPGTGGNSYYVLVPLEGAALQLAAAWDAKFPTRVDQERAQHDAQQAQQATAPAANPLTAALAALQGGAAPQPTPLAQAAGVGVTPQDNQAAQVAALQAQLAALVGQGAPLLPSPAAAPTAQPVQQAAAPPMSDADLEAAIKALG